MSNELQLIQETLQQVSLQLNDQRKRDEVTQAKLTEQNRALEDVEEKLPGFVQRRGFGLTVAALVLAGTAVAASVFAIRQSAQQDRQTDRIAGVSRAYANCTAINRAFHGVDVGYTALAAQAIANAENDAKREEIRESHRRLRSGLQRSDCSGLLSTIDEGAAERVKAEASRVLPTLPLPPPPTG